MGLRVYSGLGRLAAASSVEPPAELVTSCRDAFGWPEDTCRLFLLDIPNIPGAAETIMRSAVIYGEKAGCVYGAAYAGVPRTLATPACSWAVDKINSFLGQLWHWIKDILPEDEWFPAYAKAKYHGVYWRTVSAMNARGPGETFYSKDETRPIPPVQSVLLYQKGINTRAPRVEANVAVLLDDDDKPRKFVYVPCGRIKPTENTGQILCMDKDGVTRNVGADPSSPKRYRTGFFRKRTRYWPQEFEDNPWQPPVPAWKRALDATRTDARAQAAATNIPVASGAGGVAVAAAAGGAALLLYFLL